MRVPFNRIPSLYILRVYHTPRYPAIPTRQGPSNRWLPLVRHRQLPHAKSRQLLSADFSIAHRITTTLSLFKENGNHTIPPHYSLPFAIMMRVILSLLMLLSAAVAFVPGATRPSFAPTRLFMAEEMKKGTVKWCVPSGFLFPSPSGRFAPFVTAVADMSPCSTLLTIIVRTHPW